MKIFQILSLLLLLIKINSQLSKNTNNNTTENKNNTPPKNSTLNINQNKVSQNKTANEKILSNNTKQDLNLTKKEEKKPFNLTESLINFFLETFGNNTKKDSNKTKDSNEKDEENEKKKREAEIRKKWTEEREKKRKEIEEKNANLEKIKIENEKKKEKTKDYVEARENFVKLLANNSFDEVIQINLQKGESETLYLDLQNFTKIKMAIMISDSEPEEKINFFFTGPNAKGRNIVIQQYFSKNYLFWEYEVPRNGEYYVEITNKGTKMNEIFFLFNDSTFKKKDLIDTEKLDKISLLLNNIDYNINQLRNKKKIEVKQVHSHNNKVTENNTWIVIYSIIEICTMIMVFLIQSCYINSIVNKV